MKKIILLIILVIALIGGWYAYKEYNRKNVDLMEAKADESSDAINLIKAFETDSAVANKKYLGKIVAITGNIKAIEKDLNNTTIVLGDVSQMSSVRCSMDTTYTKDITVKEGQQVTIKGNCTGYNQNDIPELGSDVILNRCVISSKK